MVAYKRIIKVAQVDIQKFAFTFGVQIDLLQYFLELTQRSLIQLFCDFKRIQYFSVIFNRAEMKVRSSDQRCQQTFQIILDIFTYAQVSDQDLEVYLDNNVESELVGVIVVVEKIETLTSDYVPVFALLC